LDGAGYTVPADSIFCGSGFPAAIRHSGRREAAIRNPEKTILYWIPDLDFVSSGMTIVYCLLQSKGKEKSSATDN
jgi:hypothetical protein